MSSAQSYVGMSHTARLEAKIRELEESIRLAEEAASTSAVAAKAWSNPILSGEQRIPRVRLDLDQFIMAYPAPKTMGKMLNSIGFGFEGVESELGQSPLMRVSRPCVILHD